MKLNEYLSRSGIKLHDSNICSENDDWKYIMVYGKDHINRFCTLIGSFENINSLRNEISQNHDQILDLKFYMRTSHSPYILIQFYYDEGGNTGFIADEIQDLQKYLNRFLSTNYIVEYYRDASWSDYKEFIKRHK